MRFHLKNHLDRDLVALQIPRCRCISLIVHALLLLCCWVVLCPQSTSAATVAYWRFESGPAFTNVAHPGGDGDFNGTIRDVSGNGNHLSTWSFGGFAGFAYRSDVPYGGRVPQTAQSNLFSVKNTGAYPAMLTSAAWSAPTYGTFRKALTANYNPGVPTAQASYSGWIDFGVGTYWGWGGMLQNGVWTGVNGIAMVRSFDGPTANINSDGTHFWPYGLNYDNEGGTENFRRHVVMVDAFRKDLGIQ